LKTPAQLAAREREGHLVTRTASCILRLGDLGASGIVILSAKLVALPKNRLSGIHPRNDAR